MARYKPYSYEQGELIPVQFEKQILPESFEYALNYIVEHKMDVSAFEDRIKNDETGAPAYNPRILLKIVFYAYARGIIFSREIAKACEENVTFMALSANTRPHFTTIADFISSMSDGIEPLFLNILMYCDQLGLIGKEMFAIDGCKISSNASKEWSGTKEDFEKRKNKYRESISFLMKKHREEDEKKIVSEEREKEEKTKKKLEEKIEKIDEWLNTHDDKIGKAGQAKKSHLIDNESAKMPSSHGVIQGYNGIAAVDGKHQIVVGAQAVGDGSEQETLKPMIEEVEENFNSLGKEEIYKEAKITADSGFHNEANMKMLREKEIDAYVADHQFRKRDPRFESADRHKKPIDKYKGKKNQRKYFSPEDFELDTNTGKLLCPAGKLLYVKDRNFTTGKGQYGTAYMAKVTDCPVCELKEKCLRKPETTRARQVVKFEGRIKSNSATQWMKERIDTVAGRLLYSLRMGIVEPVFANIRDKLGLHRFTMRGQIKVDAQWKMYALVHNMFKIYRYGWVKAETG